MGKPKTPNQKKAYNALNSRLSQYMARVQSIYDELCLQTARIVEATAYDGSAAFLFADYPDVAQMVEDLKSEFFGQMRGLIYSGTSAEWKQSNMMQDLLAKKVLKYYDAQIDGQRQRVYFQSNSDALRAFQNRTEHGMNLSAKIWNQSENYVQEMEYAISSAIEKGMSAVTLSKRLSKYLNDFDTLKADYEEKYGHAVDCADCEYRSLRLARSEINMAYRSAEQARWQQFDFITGYEVKLSGSHPKPDICDALAGKYPKDFVWTGWHPNDLCYVVPIIMSEDDYWKMREGKIAPQEQQVTELPESFKDYVRDNQSKIEAAQGRGTAPYWVRDNIGKIDRALQPSDWRITEDDIAELRSLNFGGFDAKAYNQSAMRGFNLPRFDKGLEAVGDEHQIYWSEKSVHIWDNGNVTLKYKGLADSAKYADVELERHFQRTSRGLEVSHAIFDLPDELQAKGISKAVFRNLFREYGDMGVARINVRANMSVGGYCWARYGFCTSRSQALSLAEQALSEARITEAEYEKAVAIIKSNGSSESFPMNYLANAPFGRRMLEAKNVEWNGFLDFSDSMQARYMKDYVSYPKKM